VIHALRLCHCRALPLTGSLACKPEPDWVFTQLGSAPHSGNACICAGLSGALLQAPSSKTQYNISASRL
jgi:hypothetical protein